MPLFTTLPNALGHLNSLFGGDNWGKCSTVMYPVWLLVACFFMMDQLVVWTEVLRPLHFNKSVHTHLYFEWLSSWKAFSVLPIKRQKQMKRKTGYSRSEGKQEGWVCLGAALRKPSLQAQRHGAAWYLCFTWLWSKMTAESCCAAIISQQMWQQVSKCRNTSFHSCSPVPLFCLPAREFPTHPPVKLDYPVQAFYCFMYVIRITANNWCLSWKKDPTAFVALHRMNVPQPPRMHLL